MLVALIIDRKRLLDMSRILCYALLVKHKSKSFKQELKIMAIVSAGWRLFVTLLDNGGNTSTKTYKMTTAGTNAVVDADTALAAATAIVAALNGVTDAVVIDYGYYEKFVEDSVSYPADGVQLEDQALLDFDLVGNPTKHATAAIPAPSIGIFMATSGAGANVVDTSDAALITYRDLFRTNGFVEISDGEIANSLVKGKRIHRRNNRG